MTSTADIRQAPAHARCFRPHRYFLIVGVVGLVFFAAAGVLSTLLALFNIDGSFARPELAALIVGIGWSAFTLFAVWLIAAYFRERLVLCSDKILQHGILFSRTFNVPDVLQVRWRTWPAGGSIVVYTRWQKIRIFLNNFRKYEREEIVLFFRETFAEELQRNWPRFDEWDTRSSLPEQNLSRKGMIAPGVSFMCAAAVFAYLGENFRLMAIVSAVIAVCYFARVCRPPQ